jgi:hypothetical protein
MVTKDVRQAVRRYRWRQQLPFLWGDALYERYEFSWQYYAEPRRNLALGVDLFVYDATVPSDPDWGDFV